MSGLDPTAFSCVLDVVAPSFPADPSLHQLDSQAVMDDLEAEQETVPNVSEDNAYNLQELLSTVNEVSRGVSDGTHAEYWRCVLPPAGPVYS